MGTSAVAKAEKVNKEKLPPLDLTFLVLVVLVLISGLVMLFSASYAAGLADEGDSMYYIKRQLIAALLGVGAMLVTSRLDYRIYRKLSWVAAAVSVLLLILVFPMGVTVNGARRWLYLGLRFQPSEIAKIGMILVLAHVIAKNYDKMSTFTSGIMIPLGITGVFALLVIIEPHLSSALLLVIIGVVMVFVGGANWKHLLLCFLVVLLLVVLVVSMTSYMGKRVNAWLDPWSDPQGEGYQIIQSLYAIGSGGLMGLGLGNSQQKYGYLPEAHNDYIFSIACEELGFIGAVVIILLFALLVWRGFRIALKARDKFGCLICVGVMTQIGAQTLLNIAVVSNAIPSTGISLPFFSYGGTSLVLLLLEMGVVLNISRYSNTEKG
ncbi:MAG: putative lipid II flippase FtsW [Clostridia bacterium]|nr:putative lipid II flippase FtsW [Clostridia bacterium]